MRLKRELIGDPELAISMVEIEIRVETSSDL